MMILSMSVGGQGIFISTRSNVEEAMILDEACEFVKRFCLLIGYGKVEIDDVDNYDTHWAIGCYYFYTADGSHNEDGSRQRQRTMVLLRFVVGKKFGDLYSPPSLSNKPVVYNDFQAIQEVFNLCTKEDLDKFEREKASRNE